jgi:hypothetical protein
VKNSDVGIFAPKLCGYEEFLLLRLTSFGRYSAANIGGKFRRAKLQTQLGTARTMKEQTQRL